MLKKKDASIENFIAMGIITIVILFCMFSIKSKEINLTSNYIQDGLVASNLSAAIVDLKEYGTSNKIINNEFDKSFNMYKKALKENLKLDENFNPINTNFVDSKINIEVFSIYNVEGNDIHMTKRQSNGNVIKEVFKNGLGSVKTPDGVLIETTTIYSRIGFELRGYLKNAHYAYKENSVDVIDKQQ